MNFSLENLDNVENFNNSKNYYKIRHSYKYGYSGSGIYLGVIKDNKLILKYRLSKKIIDNAPLFSLDALSRGAVAKEVRKDLREAIFKCNDVAFLSIGDSILNILAPVKYKNLHQYRQAKKRASRLGLKEWYNSTL